MFSGSHRSRIIARDPLSALLRAAKRCSNSNNSTALERRTRPTVLQQTVWPSCSADTVCPRPSVTLTFDHLTLKLVCESHLRWGTFIASLGTLGHWGSRIIRYVRDGRSDKQTDGRTDKSNAYCLLPYGRGHNNVA